MTIFILLLFFAEVKLANNQIIGVTELGEFVTANISKIKHLPIWTFHGIADDMIHIEEAERICKRLKMLKSHIRFRRIKNGNYGIQYLYEDPKIYRWMLRQRKSR